MCGSERTSVTYMDCQIGRGEVVAGVYLLRYVMEVGTGELERLGGAWGVYGFVGKRGEVGSGGCVGLWREGYEFIDRREGCGRGGCESGFVGGGGVVWGHDGVVECVERCVLLRVGLVDGNDVWEDDGLGMISCVRRGGMTAGVHISIFSGGLAEGE
ncbi:hypothetical protein Tco_0800844 [Tanacetum coccineum]|uniref:Uncharacterized protein n=1 Tax=Tanacetum coccineum TaxID=301880 RepID=A0ABQ4ZX61_9ASTR